MKMKQDNRGLTLIELIIAIAVSTIILGATLLFISNALRSYNFATNTIDLQMESHVMMEQVGAWIMEGNRIEVANGVEVRFLDADADEIPPKVDNVLVIYQIPRTSDMGRLPAGLTRDENGNLKKGTDSDPSATPVPVKASKRVVWMQDNKLYTMVIDIVGDFDGDKTELIDEVDEWGHCICEYMEVFEPKWNPDKKTVNIEVLLKEGIQEYQLRNEFKVRNEILTTPSPTP